MKSKKKMAKHLTTTFMAFFNQKSDVDKKQQPQTNKQNKLMKEIQRKFICYPSQPSGLFGALFEL